MKKIEFIVDNEMNEIILKLKNDIKNGKYIISSFDKFVETSILVFQKLLNNHITAEEFDMFIDYCRIKREPTKIDA